MTKIDVTKTYCNPIPLPDYPLGRNCFNTGWKHRADFRETADPTVIYEDGKWYLCTANPSFDYIGALLPPYSALTPTDEHGLYLYAMNSGVVTDIYE